MNIKLASRLGASLLSLLIALAGCSRAPAPVKAPRINASQAAAEAMRLYDTDKSGLLEGSELDRASGLKAAMATLDTDGDLKVSADEIEARIQSWQSSAVGIAAIMCQIDLDGEPLNDAAVSLEPEPFLGADIQAAHGTTNFDGLVVPSIPADRRPTADTPEGVQLGFYKIRISKLVDGRESIASRYNAETILGQQIANDDPAMARHRIVVHLTSEP